MMNANGAEAPAWLAISALMKITPIVGEMNARLIAMALGRPIALRFSLSSWPPVTAVTAILDLHWACF